MRLTKPELRFLRTERLLKRYAAELGVKRAVALVVVDRRSGSESPKTDWHCAPRPTIHRVIVGRDTLMKATHDDTEAALHHELLHIELEERFGINKGPDMDGLEEFYVNLEVIKRYPHLQKWILLESKEVGARKMIRHFKTHKRRRERTMCVWGQAGHLAGFALLFKLFAPLSMNAYLNKISPLFEERHFAWFFFEHLHFFEHIALPLSRKTIRDYIDLQKRCIKKQNKQTTQHKTRQR